VHDAAPPSFHDIPHSLATRSILCIKVTERLE
jgi:hypothetical protein